MAAGHDVVWVRNAAPGMGDPDVLAWAKRDARILLTFDKDFGELARASALPNTCGVVLFRMSMPKPGDAGQRLRSLVTSREDWAGHFGRKRACPVVERIGRRRGWPIAIPSIYVFAGLHQVWRPCAGMTTLLPHGDWAILDIRKIEEYCLSPSHPRGRHKARVFRQALELRQNDAAWLRDTLLGAARSNEASEVGADAWGTHWRLDVTIRRHGKSAVVRTIWIVRTGEIVPRFVTCWVL
jgi:hypothetical protein